MSWAWCWAGSRLVEASPQSRQERPTLLLQRTNKAFRVCKKHQASSCWLGRLYLLMILPVFLSLIQENEKTVPVKVSRGQGGPWRGCFQPTRGERSSWRPHSSPAGFQPDTFANPAPCQSVRVTGDPGWGALLQVSAIQIHTHYNCWVCQWARRPRGHSVNRVRACWEHLSVRGGRYLWKTDCNAECHQGHAKEAHRWYRDLESCNPNCKYATCFSQQQQKRECQHSGPRTNISGMISYVWTQHSI